MLRQWGLAGVMVLSLFAILRTTPASGQGLPVTPIVNHPQASAVSSRLSDLQKSEHPEGREEKENHHHHPLPPPKSDGGNHGDHDDALQSSIHRHLGGNQSPNFAGLGANGYIPPDSNIAVGPTQIVQVVNIEIAVFDKASGAIISGYPKTLSSLWTPLGGDCGSQNAGDPIAQYDAAADRWLITQLGSLAAPFSQCVAVSQTNDATGAYNLYQYDFGNNLNDYAKFGVWPDPTNNAYLSTSNLFANGANFIGAMLCAYDRAGMLNRAPSPAAICYEVANDAGYLPADLDGATLPPANSPGYFLNFQSQGALRMYQITPNFANPSSSTLSLPIDIPVNSFAMACGGGSCISQPNTAQPLASLGDRLMYRLAYRNFTDHEAMVVNHSVTVGSSVGVRWYELRGPFASGTPAVYQQGTFSPDADNRWMGSIAMDKNGNIALGYSVSSPTTFPAVRYTGRTTDLTAYPLGTMAPETTMQPGGGSQTGIDRWGDYTAMRIDPSDGITFWYTNEYYVTSSLGSWATVIGSFTIAPPPPGFSLTTAPSSFALQQGNSGNAQVNVNSQGGFNSAVNLSVSGCPPASTCSLNFGSVTPPANGTASVTLSINTTTTATPGNYTINITGTSGALNQVGSVNLTVTAIPPVLQSISVTPANPSAAAGTSVQFKATGNYSDGSAKDLTASSTWTSSNTSIATIAAGGLATTIAAGGTTIKAASGGLSGTTTLTVTAATGLTIHDHSPTSQGLQNMCVVSMLVSSSDGGGTLTICNWQNAQGQPGTITWKDPSGKVLKQYSDLQTTHYPSPKAPFFTFVFNNSRSSSVQNGFYRYVFYVTGGVVHFN